MLWSGYAFTEKFCSGYKKKFALHEHVTVIQEEKHIYATNKTKPVCGTHVFTPT